MIYSTLNCKLNWNGIVRVLGIIVLLECIGQTLSHPVKAQIIPDNTLGVERSQVTPDRIRGRESDRIEGGAIRGANLFHSFEQFNVNEGRGAYFSNPTGINNIFSRITGNHASAILGRLGVLGNANLFLMNPNGIVFGANATLDVGGSFTATTANAIQFGDRGSFHATRPQSVSSVLTVHPSAFLFTQARAGAIINRSVAPGVDERGEAISGLRVPAGANLTLLGGDIRITGGRLVASGGRIELGAVDSSGRIGWSPNNRLHFPASVDRADISFTNGAIALATANQRDGIVIYARNLDSSGRSVLGTQILPGQEDGTTPIGRIRLDATGSIQIEESALISAVEANNESAIGVRDAGGISIRGGSLFLTRSVLTTTTVGRGDAGNLTFDIVGQVALQNSEIASITAGQGTGDLGNITIDAGGGLRVDQRSVINTDARGLTRAGGDIRIQARSLQILNTSQIRTLIIETPVLDGAALIRTGGDIQIDVTEAVEIVTPIRSQRIFTGIAAGVQAEAIGTGGNIDIQARSLSITNADISTTNRAGINNEAVLEFVALNPEAGRAGNINIQVEQLRTNNGGIGADAIGTGGDITIAADTIQFRGDSDIQTLAALEAGGNITIAANSIIAFDDSDIRAFSVASRGGNISLRTPAFFAERYRPISTDSTRSDLDESLSIVERANAISTGDLDAFGRDRSASEGNDRVDVDASGIIAGGEIAIPDLSFIQNSLVEVPETAIDTDQLLANSCIARTDEGGTFLITGSDNLPERPGNESSSSFSTGTVRSTPTDPPSEMRQPEGAIEEPQGIYQLPDGRLVMSRACN